MGFPNNPSPETSRDTEHSKANEPTTCNARPHSLFDFFSILNNEAPDSGQAYLSLLDPSQQESDARKDDIALFERKSPQSRVRTRHAHGSAENITDPSLYRRGVRAHGIILGCKSDGDVELFLPNFRRQSPDFFVLGRVFLTLWSDEVGTSSTVVSAIETGERQDAKRVKVRRFVVIQANEQYCSALPITSYGGQGVAKQGVKKSEHGVVFTGKTPPAIEGDEAPARGESAMRHRPIRVVNDRPTEKLDTKARVNYGKVYTVPHHIKANSFGQVHRDSIEALVSQFINVFTPSTYGPATRRRESLARGDRASSEDSDGSDNSSAIGDR